MTMKKKSDFYSTIFSKANVGIAIGQRKPDGTLDNFTQVNDELSKMLGYTRDELLQMTPHDLVPADRHAGYKPIKTGKTTDYETERLAKDGRRVSVELRSHVFKVDDVEYVLVVLKDISERKKMEEALRQHSVKLEEMVDERTHQLTEAHKRLVRSEKLAAIGQMASGMAHDMGTPLTVITNVADYLKEVLDDADETVKTQLHRLEKQAQIANHIASDLLDFAKVRVPELEKITIDALLNEVLRQIDMPQNIVVTIEHQDDNCKVLIDFDQMVRVLSNIIGNAIQAMPDGGELEINTGEVGSHILVEIKDTGIGIPAYNLQKVFEPLFTTRSNQGSTGIGLAICQSIVEAHNGAIEVDSQEGLGTTFTIKLPCAN